MTVRKRPTQNGTHKIPTPPGGQALAGRAKPVKSIGRYTATRYCARCGHYKRRCVCTRV